MAFTGLFHGSLNETFGSEATTFQSLFSFTMSNFNFEIFNSNSPVVNSLGALLMITFITMTSIVLMNLLIARMTNSHTRISDQAFREWNFTQAQTLDTLLLWKERHMMNMLPAPLNIITSLFGMIDCLHVPQGKFSKFNDISLAGSVSNVLLLFSIGTCMRTWYKIWQLQKHLFKSTSLVIGFLTALELVLVLLWYPIWDWYALICEGKVFFIDYISKEGILNYNLESKRSTS